ncbi:MAG TPA: pitrilysin family protein [Thermoguttaceae bacterium]|nr:pitrilysin family protein [Thermoguttaceae bacterium]
MTVLARLVFVSLFGIALLPTLVPAVSAEQPPASAPVFVQRETLADGVTLARLQNGLTILVQENHSAPVATVRCYVKNTGGAFEGKWLGMGLSHLLEHQVSGGTTKTVTADEKKKIVDTFGGASNAATSSDMTFYYIDCPARHVMKCIDLVADEMQHIVFEQNVFDREFAVVQRELADGEVSRQRVLWQMLSQTVYTTHPARNPTIGYLDVLRRATREDCVEFYKSRYVPNNQVFVVVGDVKTDDVLDRVAKAFKDTPRAVETYLPMVEEPEQVAPREAVREMEGATYDMILAWPTVELSNPDLYALDVASYILSQGESSRLVKKLKYENQSALMVQSMSHTPHYVKGMFAVIAIARPDTWQQACDDALAEVYRLRDELVGPDELARAKNQKAAELVFARQTIQQAAEGLADSLITADDPAFEKKYVENIQKVTAEQVRDVARRYFTPSRLNRVIIAPPGGAPKPPAAGETAEKNEIRAIRLKNGVRVLIKQDKRLPMVNIRAIVLGGSLVDTEATAGRATLVGAMLERGTARHTAEQIAAYFDSVGGSLSMGSGRNTLFCSATVLAADFPKAAALFAECFTESTFPDDQFQKVQRLALGAIERRAASPHAEIMELFADALPADSPYHLVEGGKKETIERLTAEDLRAYHAKYFAAQNMIVTVFGDVDPDKALDAVRRGFGGVKANSELPPITFDRPNAIAKDVARHKQIGKPTGMVMLGYTGAGILDQKDHAALTVLDAITSGYSYPGGWLHEELRGEGLVYFVHATQMTGPVPGYFVVVAQTRPDKVDEVVERIQKNLEKAKSGGITREEFDRAVEMIIALHAQENTTIGEQAMQAAVDDLYGLGYEYDKSFDERIRAVTLEDVVRVAKKYLGNHVLVTASPAAAKE